MVSDSSIGNDFAPNSFAGFPEEVEVVSMKGIVMCIFRPGFASSIPETCILGQIGGEAPCVGIALRHNIFQLNRHRAVVRYDQVMFGRILQLGLH